MATKILHPSKKDPVCPSPTCPYLQHDAQALIRTANPAAAREALTVVERSTPIRRVPVTTKPPSREERRGEDESISRYEHFLVRRAQEAISRATNPERLGPLDLILYCIVENAGAKFCGVQRGLADTDSIVLFTPVVGPAKGTTLGLKLFELSTLAIKERVAVAQAQNWGKVPA